MSETSVAVPQLNLMLIDGDRTFHAIFQAAATALPGAKTMCCVAPGEALNRMDRFLPTVIVIDGRIGGASGINFVRRLRAGQTPAASGTLVMFAARDFSGGLSGKLVDVGCHGIVRKPVSTEALTRAMVRLLSKPVPFVMGGNYLGPDRRVAPPQKREPERRRQATRGGWASTPKLPGGSLPIIAIDEPATPDAANEFIGSATPAPKPASGGRGIELDSGIEAKNSGVKISLIDETPSPAKPTRSGPIEDAAPPVPVKPKRGGPVDDAPTAQQTRAAEPIEAAAEKPAPPKDTGPDISALVAEHQAWIASNGASGSRANFAGMKLAGVSLSGQNLAKANMREADLSNADLRHCVLLDVDLRNAILSQALLDEAQLAGAKIRHADLQFAQLSQSGLQGSDLAGADLRGAVLAGADLSGANLLGANICGTDLTAINLTQKQLDRAMGDTKTKLPPGLFAVRMETAPE